MIDKEKAVRFAKKLAQEAERYRDTHGYRENLGYDQRPKLTSYMGTLDLSYREESEVLSYFDGWCDAI